MKVRPHWRLFIWFCELMRFLNMLDIMENFLILVFQANIHDRGLTLILARYLYI